MSARHCCPLLLNAHRYGVRAKCRCGWISAAQSTASGASARWAEHVLAAFEDEPERQP